MSWSALAAVESLHKQGVQLDPTARYVLYMLANVANEKDLLAYPSQKYLSEVTGLSLSAVNKAIARLEEGGFVEVTPQMRDDGSRRVNLYRLTFVEPVRVTVRPTDPPGTTRTPMRRTDVGSPPTDVGSRRTDVPPTSQRRSKNQEPNHHQNHHENQETPPTPPSTALATADEPVVRADGRSVRIDYQAFVDVWNANCGMLPKVTKVTDLRKRLVKALVKSEGDEALARLADATQKVAASDWWLGKGLGFDNLMRTPGRVVEYAEKFAHSGTMRDGDRDLAAHAARTLAALNARDRQNGAPR